MILIDIIKALIAIPKIGEMIRDLLAKLKAYQSEIHRKDLEEAVIQIKTAKTKEERRAAIDRFARVVSS